MKKLSICISIIVLLFSVSVVCAGDRTSKFYDSEHRIIGYGEREGNRETFYDRSWKRKGYAIRKENRVQMYDEKWNRQGHYDADDPEEKEFENRN